MAHPQDLLNKYVKYRVDPGGTLSAIPATLFANGVLPGQTTPQAAKVQPKATSTPIIIGPLVNTTWPFTFLKYVGGAVTTAPLTTNVLTGPMSGCYLCTYSEAGANYLAHIGTANAPDSVESVSVKTAWKAFVARTAVSNVSGASPFDLYSTAEYAAAMVGPVTPMVCGYFTPGGQAYALLLAPTDRTEAMLRVAGVKNMPLRPWATLAALPEFA